MIGFFPELLPDELLYSGFARFRSALGIDGHRRTREALFGDARGISVVELPGRLAAFVRRLPPGCPYSVERLIAEHTTLPYFRPFKDPAQIARAEQRLASDNVAGLLVLLVGGSRVARPADMRYCPACAASDRARHGTAYWHRAHQLPGVACCHRHRTPLAASGVGRDDGSTRVGYVALEEVMAARPESASPVAPADVGPLGSGGPASSGSASAAVSTQALRLARDAAWLLSADLAGPGPVHLQRRYRAALSAAGLLRGTFVRLQAVRDALRTRYGTAALDRLGCATRDGSVTDWIIGAIRSPMRRHPLHHLLLAPCVGLDVAALLAAVTPQEEEDLRRDGWPPRPTRRLQPDRAPAPTPNAVTRRPNKRVVPTPEWEDKLRRLVADPAATQAAAARALGVDPVTLKRHARRLGVWRVSWGGGERFLPGTRVAEQVSARREAARDTYERLRRDHPGKSRTELLALAPHDVRWLGRFDGEWLAARKPPRRPCTTVATGVDWGARDEEWSAAVDAAAARLYALPVPKRVTETALLRSTHRVSAYRSVGRLPRTRARLAEHVEPREAFAERRLAWATAQFRAEGRAPGGPSLLMRRARLGARDVPRLRERARALAAELAAGVEASARAAGGSA